MAGERELGQNPFGDAWRFILSHGKNLLLTFDGQEFAEPHIVEPSTGLWDVEPNVFYEMHAATCEQWSEYAVERQKSGKAKYEDTVKMVRWLQKAKTPASVKAVSESLGAAVLAMGKAGALQDAPEMAHRKDLDSPGRWLAARNGVVDLRTGELLTSEEGRKKRMTLQPGLVRYQEDAEHWAVDKMFDHLDPIRAEYLKQCLGRALWGQPDRMVVMIVGERRSGKSTLFSALMAALGGYAKILTEDALRPASKYGKTGPTEERRVLVESRMALGEESADWRIGTERLKAFAGGRPMIDFQAKHQRSYTLPVTATLILSANQMPKMGLEDPAMADRLRVIRYETPPEPDPKVKVAFDGRHRAAAEAMLALLVKYASECPPDKTLEVPDIVQEDIQAAVADEQTPFQAWLTSAMETTGEYGAQGNLQSVTAGEIWDGWAMNCGKSVSDDEIEGMARKNVAKVFRSVHHPEPAAGVNRGGKIVKGWKGWRLVGYEEAQGVL